MKIWLMIQILFFEKEAICFVTFLAVYEPLYFYFYFLSSYDARCLVLSTIERDWRYLACILEAIFGFGFAPYSYKK